jgi:hypothetical protein
VSNDGISVVLLNGQRDERAVGLRHAYRFALAAVDVVQP